MNNFFFKKFLELKKKISKNHLTIGSWLQLSNADSAFILSNSKFDWLAVDLEHGSISVSDLPNINRSIILGNSIPLARVKSSNKFHIHEALDAGAYGVIIPNIISKEHLDETIKFCYYPPKGVRGVGFCAANSYGINFEEYKIFSQKPIIIAMIECSEGLKNIEEIVLCKGLDGILIGPYDLSASLKITSQFKNLIFQRSIKKILKVCKKNFISVGIHQVKPVPLELKRLIKLGFNFIPYGIDTVFLQNSYPLKKVE